MPIEVRTLAEWEAAGAPGLLSVVIPAHNEEGHIADTVRGLAATLRRAGIGYEIVVVNDNSSDATERILISLSAADPSVRYVNNAPPHGFGLAVRRGLAISSPFTAGWTTTMTASLARVLCAAVGSATIRS
jgi:dolichol-phosphate mannosyltransferase